MEKRYYSRCLYGGYERSDFRPSEGFSGKSWTSSHPRRKNAAAAISILLVLILGILLVGCKTHQTVIKEETVTRYVDSTIWHTDTTYFQVPVEVYADYTSLLDTLSLETNYAIAWSAVDTNNMFLVGEIRNKDIKVPVKYLWKEKVVTKDTTIYKEHTEYVPKDVIIEKTKNSKFANACIVWSILSIILIGVFIYIKIKKPF